MRRFGCLVALLVVGCKSPAAVPTPSPTPVPIDQHGELDPVVKRGTLPNGFTYNISRDPKAGQRAALWLVVRTARDGAKVDDDPTDAKYELRELPHFVKHLAFVGTEHFGKHEIADFIAKAGMPAGPDPHLQNNHATAPEDPHDLVRVEFERTIYHLWIPTDGTTRRKGLDLLRDWAGSVTFDTAEVELERAAILAEPRRTRGWRNRDLGESRVLKTATRDVLRQFYRQWYQPQNMAVIAVGDFDEKELEREIVARFGDLPKAITQKPPAIAPSSGGTTVEIRETMSTSNVAIVDHVDPHRGATKADYRRFLVDRLYHDIVHERLAEIAWEPSGPFATSSVRSDEREYRESPDTFTLWAQSRWDRTRGDRIEEVLEGLLRELARIEQHGVLATELARTAKALLASSETYAADWAKMSARQTADLLALDFVRRAPSRHFDIALERELIPQITVAELDQVAKAWSRGRRRSIQIEVNGSFKPPTEGRIQAIVTAVATKPLDPWKPGMPRLESDEVVGTTSGAPDTHHDACQTYAGDHAYRLRIDASGTYRFFLETAGWSGTLSIVRDGKPTACYPLSKGSQDHVVESGIYLIVVDGRTKADHGPYKLHVAPAPGCCNLD